MPATDTKKPRKIIDWESIEEEFRAGQLSVAEIARRFETTHQAIFNRAKRKGWVRNLAVNVARRARHKLVADIADRDATDTEIIEAASERSASVVRLHRQDIAKLKDMEQKLLSELGDNPKKTWVGQYQGEVITKDLSITVTDRCQALNNLANVQHKRIQLERQAYNLDETGSGETIEERLKKLEGDK